MIGCGLKTGREKEINLAKKIVAPSAAAVGKMHNAVAANLALHFQLSLSNYIIPHMPKEKIQLKIGIHTGFLFKKCFKSSWYRITFLGSVITGVIGNTAPQYCVFGDTVNVAGKLLEYGKGREKPASYFSERFS